MKKTLNSIQALRALAFILIFVSHTSISIFAASGGLGVSIFFILSGFLMTYSYFNSDRIKKYDMKSNFSFAISKIKKLYLLHLITLLLAIPFCFKITKNFFSIFTWIMQLITNVFLVQTWIPNEGFYYSFNGVSWYLSVSLFLYFVFPLILKMMKKYKSNLGPIITIIVTFLFQICLAFISHKINMSLLSNTKLFLWFTYIFPLSRLEDFIIGCNIGYIFLNSNQNILKKWHYTLIEIIMLLILLLKIKLCLNLIYYPILNGLTQNVEYWWCNTSIYTVSSCFIIYLFAVKKGIISNILTNKCLIFIGNLSPYAFLIHQLVIQYSYKFSIHFLEKDYIILSSIICFIITLILSLIFKKIHESITKKI